MVDLATGGFWGLLGAACGCLELPEAAWGCLGLPEAIIQLKYSYNTTIIQLEYS